MKWFLKQTNKRLYLNNQINTITKFHTFKFIIVWIYDIKESLSVLPSTLVVVKPTNEINIVSCYITLIVSNSLI